MQSRSGQAQAFMNLSESLQRSIRIKSAAAVMSISMLGASVSLAADVEVVDIGRAAGGTVDQHVYDGEGHGFSKEATIIDSFERIDTFLTRWVVQR